MYSRSTSSGNTTAPFPVPTTTVATSNRQNEHRNAPDRSATNAAAPTRDFYLDTFFNPVWMSGPNVFSFAENGTVVRPESYAPEPYPGYHADRPRCLDSADASHFQGFAGKDPKPWKNVAITEQDDAEFEAFQERMRLAALGEWARQFPRNGLCEPSPKPQEPELVYTWPPKPGAC